MTLAEALKTGKLIRRAGDIRPAGKPVETLGVISISYIAKPFDGKGEDRVVTLGISAESQIATDWEIE